MVLNVREKKNSQGLLFQLMLIVKRQKQQQVFQACLALFYCCTAQPGFHYGLTVCEVVSPVEENLIDFGVRRVTLEGDKKNSCAQSSEVKTGGCANNVLASSLLLAHQQNETRFYKGLCCPMKLETS